jgi:hypothetical protein
MAHSATHIVQKSHLKIKLLDQARAYEIQSLILEIFQSKGLEILEQEMDLLCPPGQVIQLDRLHLDLGNISLENLNTDLPRLIGLKVREELSKIMAPAASEANTSKPKQVDAPISDLNTLMFFLETGRFGWEVNERAVRPEELLGRLLTTQPIALKAALESRLANRRICERLSLQFSPSLRKQLITLLQDARPFNIASLLETLTRGLNGLATELKMFPQAKDRQAAMVDAWILYRIATASGMEEVPAIELQQFLMDAISDGKISLSALKAQVQMLELPALLRLIALLDEGFHTMALSTDLAAQIQRIHPSASMYLAAKLRTFLMEWSQNESLVANQGTLKAHLIAELPKGILEAIPVEEILQTLGLHKAGTQLATTKNALREEAPANPEKPKPQVPKPPSPSLSIPFGEKEAVYVENAGLVLLNPFLQHCFQDLGWMTGNEFLDGEAQENAVLLVAYMACGENEISEARLPLAKLLCGMELDHPVRAQVDLPDRALTEADNLLLAANGYWERAGKLTPAQFREAFLMREGRLTQMGSGWDLKVDRHTIDILLEFLPWSFGTIKLPWMPGMLSVDW